MKELEAYTASVVIGLCLGLIGAGGSILTIPVFVYVLKTDPAVSTVYSMFIVGLCSLTGSVLSFFKKLVDVKAALAFGVPSVLGVFIARKLIAPNIPDQLFVIHSFPVSKNFFIMISLSVIMFIVSLKMLKKTTVRIVREDKKQEQTALFISRGILTGIITGLLGVGGGFLIAPALLLWLKLPVKTAIGTTLLIITLNSLTGFLTSYASVVMDWSLLLKFTIGAIAGIVCGTKLSERICGDNLKIMLAWFIIVT